MNWSISKAKENSDQSRESARLCKMQLESKQRLQLHRNKEVREHRNNSVGRCRGREFPKSNQTPTHTFEKLQKLNEELIPPQKQNTAQR